MIKFDVKPISVLKKGKKMKRFLLYLLRWQLSTPILAVCLILFAALGTTTATILSNLIGGVIFFWVDRWIFKLKKSTPAP